MDAFSQILSTVLEVKRLYEEQLMKLTNVVAAGIGYKIAGDTLTDEVSIVVSVTNRMSPWTLRLERGPTSSLEWTPAPSS